MHCSPPPKAAMLQPTPLTTYHPCSHKCTTSRPQLCGHSKSPLEAKDPTITAIHQPPNTLCHTPTASESTPATRPFLIGTHQTLQTEPIWHPATPDLALRPTSPSLSVLSPGPVSLHLRAFAHTTSHPGRQFLSIPTGLILCISSAQMSPRGRPSLAPVTSNPSTYQDSTMLSAGSKPYWINHHSSRR